MPTYPFSTHTLHTHALVAFRHSNKDTHYLRHVMHIFWTHTQPSSSQTTPHTITCQTLVYHAWTNLHEYITSDTPHTYFASNYISYTSIFHIPNHHTTKLTHACTPETSSRTSYMRTPYQIPITPRSRHFTNQWISRPTHRTSHPEYHTLNTQHFRHTTHTSFLLCTYMHTPCMHIYHHLPLFLSTLTYISQVLKYANLIHRAHTFQAFPYHPHVPRQDNLPGSRNMRDPGSMRQESWGELLWSDSSLP